jgi:subtilase family serine protease
MAPDADIVYLGTKCDDDLGALSDLDALTQIVDQRLATIVSNSWSTGLTSPGQAAAYEQVFQQGAAEGIGFYFSSGDYGDGSARFVAHQPQLNYPASDPWVTSVGGTTLAVNSHDGYEWETGWGDSAARLTSGGTAWANLPGTFQMGSGGGTSTMFTQPAYQRRVVPAALSCAHGSSSPMRVVPDIAADADPLTGILIGQTVSRAPGQPARYGEGAFGGTSASAPLIAGIQADAEQAADVAIGFANPAIYALYGSPAYHDVTDDPLGPGVRIAAVVPAPATVAPQVYTFGLDQGLTATSGYDDVTGVGTPAPAYYASYRSA